MGWRSMKSLRTALSDLPVLLETAAMRPLIQTIYYRLGSILTIVRDNLNGRNASGWNACAPVLSAPSFARSDAEVANPDRSANLSTA